ncbi:uncharacterized protein [Primulina eburnea]|uniref:uncharacterized protein n=1 Tax=Primulina eburnea TaxID=1245227 RepID=UPI003C6C8344
MTYKPSFKKIEVPDEMEDAAECDKAMHKEQNTDESSKVDGDGTNAQKKHGIKSFASLFKDNRSLIEASMLNFIAPPVGEVEIGIEEIDSVEKSFGYCLVGYVMGPRLSPFAVLNFIKGWGGNVEFLFKDNGWIKFQFPNELERERVLDGGPYTILGRQLLFKKLPSCFLFTKEDMVFYLLGCRSLGSLQTAGQNLP